MLWYRKRLWVPEVKEIKELILREAHDSAYSIHPASTKMYHDLKSKYWLYGMKRVVDEYQRPTGLLQPLKIHQWKWEEISMGFIVGLPTTQTGYDSI
jgi:hypothetical protein